MVRIGFNFSIEIRETSRQASISNKIDGKFRPVPPLSQNQRDKMVCFGLRIHCPSFLLFDEILNLTLTLYLKAKASVETGAVQFTNLALMLFPFIGSISLRSHREEDKGKLL